MVIRMDSLEASNNVLEQKVEQLQDRVIELEARECKCNNDLVNEMESRLDELEQKSLSQKLILKIDDVSDSRNFDLAAVRNYLSNKLQMSAEEVGTINGYPLSDDGHRFVLDVTTQSTRYKLFKQCKAIKPSTIYLNEFLTKKRDKMMFDLRRLKETKPSLKRVYSDHGRVFCVIDGRNDRLRVRSIEDVLDVLNNSA